ncbi:MAG: C40 family peptidase, partial [Abditibacteriota bacterium]|nr:C40 family peptidase [Abditibacteriota bacterium]
SKVGTPVSKSDLQPGDLVFFNTRGRGVSHVAIYIGNGNIVHASSVRTGVKVDSLSSAYYKSRYHSARRVK